MRKFLGFVAIVGLAGSLQAGKGLPGQPGEETVPGQVIVRLKQGAPPGLLRALLGPQVSSRQVNSKLDLHLVEVAEAVGLAIASHPLIRYVEPNRIRRSQVAAPTDPYYSASQYALQNVQALAAWRMFPNRYLTAATAGTGRIRVAVLDTGADCTHPDFKNSGGASTDSAFGGQLNWSLSQALVPTMLFSPACPWQDDNGHGTHTAGTIGALGNNSLGVTGANWDVQIMPLKCFDSTGSGTTAWAISGIDYALQNGARILNNSWGTIYNDSALLDALKRAEAAGALFVASAGNGGANNDVTPFFPCSYSSAVFTGSVIPPTNILCVAATDDMDNHAGFTNYGAKTVHMGAPGVGILSTWINQNYMSLDGTSMATPHVTGAAALLKGCKASLSPMAIRQILLARTRPVLDLSGATTTGGVVNYEAAINDRRAAGSGYCDPIPSNVSPVANPGGPYASNYRKPLQLDGTGSNDPDGQILIYFWDFGDGTTGLESTPTHQYATGGVYTVRLTVRDNLGGMSSQVTTATMRPAKH